MKLLRLPSVIEKIEGTRSFLYQEMAAGRFPKPVKIGRRAVAWPSDEIDAWIEARMAEREDA
jgi:prophage regulatory protein